MPRHAGRVRAARPVRCQQRARSNPLFDRVARGSPPVIDKHKPLHVSLVGGDPLVRYRELELLLPQIEARGIHTQVVTKLPSGLATWTSFSPSGVAAQRSRRSGSASSSPSSAPPTQRSSGPRSAPPFIARLRELRVKYPVLDMPPAVMDEIVAPPRSPDECIFARTTETISADLTTRITPCQFGGEPDCGQCGCIASMGLAAVGHHKVLGPLTAGHLFIASERVGKAWRSLQKTLVRGPVLDQQPAPFKIL